MAAITPCIVFVVIGNSFPLTGTPSIGGADERSEICQVKLNSPRGRQTLASLSARDNEA
jgi:hypothetical protein